MKVTIEMTSEEFVEFLNWKKEDGYYRKKIENADRVAAMMARSVNYAIEPDPKKQDKYIIVDHGHADDLYMMAGDIWGKYDGR